MKKLLLIAALLLPLSASADKCKALTKAKEPCSRNAVLNGYCRQHSPDRVHCQGQTKTGQPCQNSPKTGTQTCHLHQPGK